MTVNVDDFVRAPGRPWATVLAVYAREVLVMLSDEQTLDIYPLAGLLRREV